MQARRDTPLAPRHRLHPIIKQSVQQCQLNTRTQHQLLPAAAERDASGDECQLHAQARKTSCRWARSDVGGGSSGGGGGGGGEVDEEYLEPRIGADGGDERSVRMKRMEGEGQTFGEDWKREEGDMRIVMKEWKGLSDESLGEVTRPKEDKWEISEELAWGRRRGR